MHARAAVVAALGVCVSGCPFISPGLRGDLGISGASIAGKAAPALHATVGASLASIIPDDDFPIDVGLSYVLFVADYRFPVNGLAADVAWLHHIKKTAVRTSLGARAELLLQDREGLALGSGGAVRFAVELMGASSGDFSSTHGNTGGLSWVGGYHIGTVGFGLYVEAGVRRLPGAIFSWYGSLGFTFRLPTAIGVAVFIPFPR
jgi:hypothetical protein